MRKGTPGNIIEQRVRCLLAAAIPFALLVAAKLIRLRRVNSEYANSGAVDFDGVAVDGTDACPIRRCTGRSKARAARHVGRQLQGAVELSGLQAVRWTAGRPFGGLKLADKQLTSNVDCVDDEIIDGWSGVNDASATD
jgi:hypothetical protein